MYLNFQRITKTIVIMSKYLRLLYKIRLNLTQSKIFTIFKNFCWHCPNISPFPENALGPRNISNTLCTSKHFVKAIILTCLLTVIFSLTKLFFRPIFFLLQNCSFWHTYFWIQIYCRPKLTLWHYSFLIKILWGHSSLGKLYFVILIFIFFIFLCFA